MLTRCMNGCNAITATNGARENLDCSSMWRQSIRSRSPAGSRSAGPSVSQVAPVSVLSSRRPVDRRSQHSRTSVNLRENTGAQGSRGSVVGDGSGSSSETLADLFLATANLLRRTT